jgi:fusaric acid resistance family protein
VRDVLKHAGTSALAFDWSKFDAVAAARCTVGVGIPLVGGVMIGQPSIGVFGAVGALSVGFGSFQDAEHGRVPAMFLAAIGMAASLFIGSIAGYSTAASVGVAATWGLASGLLTALGPAAAFVGLQAAVGVLVALAFPAAATAAAQRAGLVVAGGLLEILLLFAARPRTPVNAEALRRKAVSSIQELRERASMPSPARSYAVRLAVALAAATLLYRWLAWPRGSWIPLTALLVLKPELHETFARGLARMAGTIIGAGCATAITVTLAPGATLLTLLAILFVWAGYALFRTNYGLFTICITGYVVFLVVLAGGAEPATAEYRIINTLIGGGLALTFAAAWPAAAEATANRVRDEGAV